MVFFLGEGGRGVVGLGWEGRVVQAELTPSNLFEPLMAVGVFFKKNLNCCLLLFFSF